MAFELDPTVALALGVVGITAMLVLMLSPSRNGTVAELNVYPIKSCAETTVPTAFATEHGFKNDRIAQVVDKTGMYCTPRDKDNAKLFHVKPELEDGVLTLSAPDVAPLTIDLNATKTTTTLATPMAGPKVTLQDYGNDVAKWFERATGMKGCRLAGMGDGYVRHVVVNEEQGDEVPTPKAPISLADEAPYLLTSTSSLKDLNKRLKARGKEAVDMRRFRPNIVVDSLKPWEEDTFKKIRIGAVEFWAWQRCGRCNMTTIDRDSLKRGPEPLATLSTFRERAHGQRNFGMHLVPVGPFTADNQVCVGDEVEILEYDEERKAEWKRLFG